MTARAASQDVVTGLDAGADEYLTKPIDQASLVARVRSMLRVKALHDQVQAQAADLATWNRTLEERVNQQVSELDRMNRLEALSVAADRQARGVVGRRQAFGKPSSRHYTVVFCDLRGFTAFAEKRGAGRHHRGVTGYIISALANRSTASRARCSISPATAC